VTPRIITTEAEYAAAIDHLGRLQASAPGPERDRDIQLWALLIERYEGTSFLSSAPTLARLITRHRMRSAMARKHPKPLGPAVPDWRLWVFFGGFALFLYLRLQYLASYFPPFFEGEEARALDIAKFTSEYAAYAHSWWAAFKGGAIEYNKGYSWALVPFISHFGYDVRLITYILPVFFSLFVAAFFAIFRKAYPKSSLLSFAVVAMFSVLCLCLRRYKWHSMAYLTAISIYLYFQPLFHNGAMIRRAKWRIAAALFLFTLSCYLYFGCFLYVAPFFFLVAFFSTRAQRRRELVLAMVGFAVFSAVFAVACNMNDVWRWRMVDEFGFLQGDASASGLQQRWWATRDFFYTLDLSRPFLVLFVIGAVSSWYRIRRGDRFALVNATLLLGLWAFELLVQGLNNPDQLNWSMIPFLGILLTGADEVFVTLRQNVRFGTAIGLTLALLISWNEMEHYIPLNRDTPYQPFVQTRNTRTQAALLLRMIRDDDSGSVQYYMPDPAVPETEGGFDYNVSLLREDYAKALARVAYFRGPEDLRRELLRQRRDKWAVVYMSVSYPEIPDNLPKDAINGRLFGLAPEIITPFDDVYGIKFLVRRFKLRPGPQPNLVPAPVPGHPG
jgi:hypothetical protein